MNRVTRLVQQLHEVVKPSAAVGGEDPRLALAITPGAQAGRLPELCEGDGGLPLARLQIVPNVERSGICPVVAVKPVVDLPQRISTHPLRKEATDRVVLIKPVPRFDQQRGGMVSPRTEHTHKGRLGLCRLQP